MEVREWREQGPVDLDRLTDLVRRFQAKEIDGSEIFRELDPMLHKWTHTFQKQWAEKWGLEYGDTYLLCLEGVYHGLDRIFADQSVNIKGLEKSAWFAVSNRIRQERMRSKYRKEAERAAHDLDPPTSQKEDPEFWAVVREFVDGLEPRDRQIFETMKLGPFHEKMTIHREREGITRQRMNQIVQRIREDFRAHLDKNLPEFIA